MFPQSDEFMDTFHYNMKEWYGKKTEQEKEWLNQNKNAEKLMKLMFDGFDNMLKVNGVSK